MSRLTAKSAALALSLAVPVFGAEKNVPNDSSPTTAVAPQSALSKEHALISDGWAKAQAGWRCFDAKTEGRLRDILGEVKTDGYRSEDIRQEYVAGYRILTTIDYARVSKLAPADPKEFKETEQKIFDQLSALKELRTEGFIARKDVVVFPLKDGSIRVAVLSSAGPKGELRPDAGAEAVGIASSAGRQALWAGAISDLAIRLRLDAGTSGQISSEGLQTLHQLQGYYEGRGDSDFTRLTQALITYLAPNPSTMRRYADLGKFTDQEARGLPGVVGEAVDKVNALTANLPSPKDLIATVERTKTTARSELVYAMLAVEKESNIYTPEVVEVANLEILDALRFAEQEWKGAKSKTPEAGAAIVRDYFERYFANEYTFQDNTPGLSGGIAIRRTDCSTRALLGYEELARMGLPSGFEMILAYKDGKPVPGVQAHMYNFIELGGGKRIYCDFCRPSGEPYVYDSNEPIIEHYRGPNKDLEIRVQASSKAEEEMVGHLLREPILEDARAFCADFQRAGKNLADFLFDSPEMIPLAQKLMLYERNCDQVFHMDHMKAWTEGTQASLRSVYPNLFGPVPASEAPTTQPVSNPQP